MKGYKVFLPDWTCRDFQYKVGETYKHEGEIKICKAGFHFCKELIDCFNYYSFNPENKVAIVEATGEVIEKSDGLSDSKCVTNEIKIVRELSWYEVLNMINTGEGNTGVKNTGNYNTGRGNSGDWNTGKFNSGKFNSGEFNSGSCNSGNCNSGNHNSGDCNSNNNNTGRFNSGICNSGKFNSGNHNTGNYNSGSSNTGNYNRGSSNIGDCNLGNKKTGCFCTNDNGDETIKLFNKESDWTLTTWRNSRAFEVMFDHFELTLWVDEYDMTDEEKERHPDYTTARGYLKELSYTEAWRNMWNKLSDKEKNEFTLLPNFDKDIFKTITGVEIEEKFVK